MRYAIWMLAQAAGLLLTSIPIWVWLICLFLNVVYFINWVSTRRERQLRYWKRRARKAGYRLRLGYDIDGKPGAIITDEDGNYLHGPYSYAKAVYWIEDHL